MRSGTTAICVNFHGNLMTVCNVGDSRAVLGHWIEEGSDAAIQLEKNKANEPRTASTTYSDEPRERATSMAGSKSFPTEGRILAIPLSRDQTPYRMDERERVKREGAAIMSIDQMEGVEDMHENWGDMVLGEDVDIYGDPPRVWVAGKDYPGTAFTRSLGDKLAEDIGVMPEPEMLSRELTSNDHVLVIASDGIFEFLTNQQVIDICTRCESPLSASEKLVKAAYDQWLIYERRTDDITAIVCFVTVERAPPSEGVEGTTEDLVALAHSAYGQKPIGSRLKKRNARGLA